jgi:hypothetical protein
MKYKCILYGDEFLDKHCHIEVVEAALGLG